MSSFCFLVITRLSFCGIDLDEQLRHPNHSSRLQKITTSVCICVYVLVRLWAFVSASLWGRERTMIERERERERLCVLKCNHVTANGGWERLWHHAGLQSCGLTSAASQQTANEWQPIQLAVKHHAEAKEPSSSLSINAQTNWITLPCDTHSIQAVPKSYQATLQQHKHGIGVQRQCRDQGSLHGEPGWGRGRGWPYYGISACKSLSFKLNLINVQIQQTQPGFAFGPSCMLILSRWM